MIKNFSFSNNFFNADPADRLKDLALVPSREKPTELKRSPHKGVHWRPSIRRWTAEIYVKRKVVRLGEFYKEGPAREAYSQAIQLIESLPPDFSVTAFKRQFYVMRRGLDRANL